MNINKFRSVVNKRGGIAHPSRYKVTIIPPTLAGIAKNVGNLFQLGNGGVSVLDRLRYASGGLINQALINRYFAAFQVDPINETRDLEFLCDRAVLPGINLNTTEQRIYGPVQNFPMDETFEPITLSFICTGEMKEKYFFDAWHYMIKDPVTNDFNYLSEYATPIIIRHYGVNGKFTYGVRLVDAYPLNISASELNYEGGGLSMRVNVTMSYKNWENLKSFDTYTDEINGVLNGVVKSSPVSNIDFGG